MSENSPVSPPKGWHVDPTWRVEPHKNDAWCAENRASAQLVSEDSRWWATVDGPERATREEAEKDRLAMVQALAGAAPSAADLQKQLAELDAAHKRLQEQYAVARNERHVALERAMEAETRLERLPNEAQQAHLHNLCDRIGAPGGKPLSQRLGWAAGALSAQLKALNEVRSPTPPPLLAPVISMALDEVKAPANESLVERIRGLGKQLEEVRRAVDGAHAPRVTPAGLLAGLSERIDLMRDAHWYEMAEARGAHDTLVEQVRQALNIGPPSDSDVKADTSPKRIVEIVRARSVLMLEERDQRVALAKEVQRLEKQAHEQRLLTIARLEGWMSGDETSVSRELEAQVIRAVEEGVVTAFDAINALRNRRDLAKLILSVDPLGDELPF